MKRKPHSRTKRTTTKSVLRLPDLEHAKAAVLNSLTSLDAQRGYRHAIMNSLTQNRASGAARAKRSYALRDDDRSAPPLVPVPHFLDISKRNSLGVDAQCATGNIGHQLPDGFDPHLGRRGGVAGSSPENL